MSLSTNFPTIRPSLYLDFAKSRTVDPRITFTRASTATYFDEDGVLQTAAVDRPRIDFNPSTLVCNGLLIEEQRTNILTYSADFADASWLVYGTCVVTSNSLVAPDGTTTADLITGATDLTAGGGNNIQKIISLTINTDYVVTVYARGGTSTNLTCRVRGSTTGTTLVNVNRTINASGYTRCQYSFNSGTNTSARMIFADDIGLGTFYLWGAQVEAGAFPTSYIPTVASTVTRSADVASMTGTNFSSWYNATEGTIFAEYVYSTTGVSNQCAYSIDNGTSSETIIMASTTPAIDRPLSSAGGVGQLTSGLGNYTFTAQQLIKRAVAYKLNDYGTSVNGGVAATDTTYTVPSPDRLVIGAAGYFSGSRLNGTIRRLTYYPARLVNAQLQALTL